MPDSLQKMSVIITGATRGIGAGIARELAHSGAYLTLGYHDDDKSAQIILDELRKISRVILCKTDSTTPDGAAHIVKAACEEYGTVHALVSNLGPFLYRTIDQTSLEEWDRMIQANLSAHFYLVHELLPIMKKNAGGHFIFIGGVGSGSITGHPKASAYYAAKTGLADFVRSLAFEEGRNGIRANLISPGIIDNGEYTEGFKARIVNEIPLGRIGSPKDLASMVKFLLSPEASYITGAIIDVSGGYHLNSK